jgi:hypothetical protein
MTGRSGVAAGVALGEAELKRLRWLAALDFLVLTELHQKPVKMAAVVRRRTRSITSQSVSFWVKKARRNMDAVLSHAATPEFARIHAGAWDDKGECCAPSLHGDNTPPTRQSPGGPSASSSARAAKAGGRYLFEQHMEMTPQGSPGGGSGSGSSEAMPRRDLFSDYHSGAGSTLLPSAAAREAQVGYHYSHGSPSGALGRHARRRSSSSTSSIGSAAAAPAVGIPGGRHRLSSTASLPAALGERYGYAGSLGSSLDMDSRNVGTPTNAITMELMSLGITWPSDNAEDDDASVSGPGSISNSESNSNSGGRNSPSFIGPTAEDLKALLCDVNGGMYVREGAQVERPASTAAASDVEDDEPLQWSLSAERGASLWDSDVLGDPFAPLGDAWTSGPAVTPAGQGLLNSSDGPVWLC